MRKGVVAGLAALLMVSLSGCMRMEVTMGVSPEGTVNSMDMLVAVQKTMIDPTVKPGQTGMDAFKEGMNKDGSSDKLECQYSENDTEYVATCTAPSGDFKEAVPTNNIKVEDGKITLTFADAEKDVATSTMTEQEALTAYSQIQAVVTDLSTTANVKASKLDGAADLVAAGVLEGVSPELVSANVGPKGGLNVMFKSWKCSGVRFAAVGAQVKGEASCKGLEPTDTASTGTPLTTAPSAGSGLSASSLLGAGDDAQSLEMMKSLGVKMTLKVVFPGPVVSTTGAAASTSTNDPNVTVVDLMQDTKDVVLVAETGGSSGFPKVWLFGAGLAVLIAGGAFLFLRRMKDDPEL